MAIWQFKFSLVPIKGIERVHGSMMTILDEYKASTPEEFSSLSEESLESDIYINYWQGIPITAEIIQAIREMLPQTNSWSEEAIMFGDIDNGGDKIEVWIDDINCYLDIRNFSSKLLSDLLTLAQQRDCMIVLQENGEVVTPDYEIVMEKIRGSKAHAFCLKFGKVS